MEPESVVKEDAANWVAKAGLLMLLALFLTGMNTLKPLTVDDSVYYLLADHIAQEPLNPYGFDAWDKQPANSVFAPPGFLYWWAIGIRLFGQDPVMWKVWLLPISLVLVFCLHAIGTRFARGMEMPFTFFVVLSSAVLPCLNLMLDIPVLALSMLMIVMFLRACDTQSLTLTLATGLLAGLATQTKYTAFITVGVIVVYAVQSGHWRRGLIVASMVACLFVGWEMVTLHLYGDSHFWLGFTQFRPSGGGKIKLIQPLAGYLGSMMAACIPLYHAATGRSVRYVCTSAAIVVAGMALVALVPLESFASIGAALNVPRWPVLSSVVFGLLGVTVLGSFSLGSVNLLREPRPLTPSGQKSHWLFSVDAFLVLWLVVEIAGYFVLSPYPAARRIIGLVVPGVLIGFRLAARTCPERPGLVWGTVGLSLLIGLWSFAVDFSELYGQKVMAEQLAVECRRQDPSAKIWFFGDGAFEIYGERAGTKRLVREDTPVSSGDWVLVVERLEHWFAVHPIRSRCVLEDVKEWSSILPIISQFQVGGVAWDRHEQALVRVRVYRAS